MMKDQGLIRFIINFLMYSSLGSAISYVVYTLSLSSLHQITETTNNSTIRKPLVLSKFFFDIQSSPMFEIIWVGQFFSCLLVATVYPDGFFFAAIYHLCSQLNILSMDIRNLIAVSKEQTFTKAIKLIVRRHIELKK